MEPTKFEIRLLKDFYEAKKEPHLFTRGSLFCFGVEVIIGKKTIKEWPYLTIFIDNILLQMERLETIKRVTVEQLPCRLELIFYEDSQLVKADIEENNVISAYYLSKKEVLEQLSAFIREFNGLYRLASKHWRTGKTQLQLRQETFAQPYILFLGVECSSCSYTAGLVFRSILFSGPTFEDANLICTKCKAIVYFDSNSCRQCPKCKSDLSSAFKVTVSRTLHLDRTYVDGAYEEYAFNTGCPKCSKRLKVDRTLVREL